MTYDNDRDDIVKTKLKLPVLVAAPNIAVLLSQQELDALGKCAVEGYNLDRSSRLLWEQRNEEAIKLALQLAEHKSFPWANCSNVKFPLLTIAALQFLARISVMTKGKSLAKVEAAGVDPTGQRTAQARRVSAHLSRQLVDDDKNWVDQDEEAKFAASIVGSAFKKTYYDSVRGINVSEHIPSMNFVVDYYCKDIDKAARATHLISMNDNAIQERVRRGLFVKMLADSGPAAPTTNLLKVAADEAEGKQRPANDTGSEYEILEQHCWLDLDGDDYAEPYIMFVRKDTAQVLRIVAKYFDEGDVHRMNDAAVRRLESQLLAMPLERNQDLVSQGVVERQIEKLRAASDNHIIRIDPLLYFTRYLFVPSPDGGVYGLGLGSLLGPMNKSVNTLVNQLIDGGTMANTAGGFLGRGVKMKGGKMAFDPFEWKPVDSTGDDLRKNIFPLPVREPSAVLFQLLGMLVTYSEKISGATDIMTGISPGQNTPAETSRNTVEQGMMLFSGIYGRMFRSLKDEIGKFHALNRLYLHSSPLYLELTTGPSAIMAPDDHLAPGLRVFPSASPEAVSQNQIKEKATALLQLSQSAPGFNTYKVTRDFLIAHDYDDIDQIFPDPAGPSAIPQGQDPKVAIKEKELQFKAQVHHDTMQLAVAELQMDAQLNQAKITEFQAKAKALLAEANGEDTYQQIAVLNAQVGAAKHRQDGLLGAIKALQQDMDLKIKAKAAGVRNEGVIAGSNGVVAPPSNAGVPLEPAGNPAGDPGAVVA